MARRKTRSTRKTRPPAGRRLPAWLTPARQREMAGAALVALAVVTLLSFMSGGGALTERWLGLLRWAFGRGAIFAPFVVGGIGAWLVVDSLDERADVRWEQPLGATLFFVALLGAAHIGRVRFLNRVSLDTYADMGQLAQGGGRVGHGVATAVTSSLGDVPGLAALVIVGAVAASLALGRSLRDTWGLVAAAGGGLAAAVGAAVRRRPPDMFEPTLDEADAFPLGEAGGVPDGSEADDGTIPAAAAVGALGRRSTDAPAAPGRRPHPEWRLPAVEDVLDEAVEIDVSEEDAEARARVIERTLDEFGIPARVVEINRGPTITQFGLEPGYIERAGKRSKVKVSRIVSLQNDLALALAASPLRVQAPVPGRPFVGVEVPNDAPAIVSLRGIIESDAFRRVASRGALPIALGRDTSGRTVAADMAGMPHLLIAGATGSGKSVCVNGLICTLIITHTPETLKLILVDPKRVELTPFRGLPHLATPVVVEIERVVGVLQWAVREMDRRYKAFAEVGARNIAVFNQQAADQDTEPLPYLVIVIDELADLMLAAPEEAERLITRLAQLARATGIHLVLATQRPSVDVVTGLIKANFPSRVAFGVTSSVDSRVILDSNGAEKLLGRGDMLYMASDSSKLLRLQGSFVSDIEIERLVRFWKGLAAAGPPADRAARELGIPEPMIQPELWEQMASGPTYERDELWEDAVALVRAHRTASTSLLQRKLRLGYSRAARIIDQLEEAGLVGPAHGNQPREVLIGPDDELPDDSTGDAEDADGGDDDAPVRPWLKR